MCVGYTMDGVLVVFSVSCFWLFIVARNYVVFVMCVCVLECRTAGTSTRNVTSSFQGPVARKPVSAIKPKVKPNS